MTPREMHLLEARRRARTIRGTRSQTMREAIIRRVIYELREALRPAAPARERAR